MTLALLILIPLAFALAVLLAPAERARFIALLGTLVAGVFAVFAVVSFDFGYAANRGQLGMDIDWLPSLGLSVSLGVDSVALWLIVLAALLGPLCVMGSWTAITEHRKMFYAWLLALQAAMTGVFAARDLVLFYICFEFTLIPMFVLIRVFGSTNRKAASVKFFLYTFTGSIIALAGLLYVVWFAARNGTGWTFDIEALTMAAYKMSAGEQSLVLLAMLAGFAVKVPLFPLHTWLPLAHTEAPTAGSVILAGVLLKLGTYGIYRFVLPFAPAAVVEYAPAIAVLCIVGIIYAGLICWVQTDVKKLVAYSSVSHLGFCVLGMVALNTTGLTGSVLYMINHGLSTGALFFLVGFMYERYHTRSMRELGGLASKMPIWGTFMVFFAMASVGLPGLNGFVSEFLCMLGAFQADAAWAGMEASTHGMPGATWGVLGPWFAAVAATGVVIAAMYLLYMVGRMCFGPLIEPAGHHDHHDAHDDGHAHLPPDLTPREIGVLLPLAALCLYLGLQPTPLMKTLEAPINDTVSLVRGSVERPDHNGAAPVHHEPAAGDEEGAGHETDDGHAGADAGEVVE
ncbi:MAG: NADH-quinone oxidoreductase subunit M [Phycisphaerales bacterium]|nr:NADH-quinone oxidoreductase subunit M [Phycisphaerales bacterium]